MAVKRIAPSGGDYTTLSAWYASLPSTLTEPEIAELEAFDLVDQLTMGSKTTSATNYIEIRAVAGHEHNGVVGSGARWRCGSSATNPTFYATAMHYRIYDVEIVMDKSGGTQEAFNLPNAAAENDVLVERCIIRSVCTDTGVPAIAAGAGNSKFRSNIVISPCRSIDSRGATSCEQSNNVYWRTADAIGSLADNNTTTRNCYSGASTGSSQCFYTATGGTGSYNASSDTTAGTLYPTGSVNSVAGTAAFTSPGSNNFTLLAGSPLIDAGTTIAAVTTDIAGTARPQGSAYDIGAFEYASADTTAPVLTSPTGTQTGPTTATVGATTDEGNGTLYAVVTTSATAPSVAQIKAGQNEAGAAAVWSGSVAVSSTGAKTLSATGLTASTSYYAHLVHADSAGNNSNVVSSAQFTTAAGADTTPPTLTGTITISSLTTTSYTASWSAGSDNVAVTGYEYRINAGTWTDNGTGLSVGISGRTPGSTDTFEVRAYDAAGNRSAPALSQDVTLNSAGAGSVTVGSALYPIRNAANTVLNESSIRVSVVRADTLEQVYHGPGHAITAGVLTVSDAAIVAGTAYHVSVKTAAGWIGMSDQVTAT